MPNRKKTKFSIFLKLIILIIVFTILVNISIGFILKRSFDKGHMKPPGKLSGKFNSYFLKDIGNPPDTVKAKSVMKDMGLNIRFETSASQWTTNPDIPRINELRSERDFDESKNNFTVRTRGRFYEISKLDDGYVIFAPPLPRDEFDLESVILPLIIIFSVLTLILYFSLRWIFGPIKLLSEGVGKISSGDFSSDVFIPRNDELGNLAASINEMKYNISNMIKAKESLLIDVSHELRSPLTRIKLANEFVEEGKVKKNIREDVIEMETMISGLLETYRTENVISKLNIKKTDVISLIKNVILKSGSEKLNFRSDFNIREISIDSEKFETAVRNIIDNALKYSEGKPVDIAVYTDNNNPYDTVISVKDYGRGIQEADIDKIFEPFYRADKSRDKKIIGYGLGLSIVKKILDLHNAKIQIFSKPSEGTEFKITFPADIL